ncbi:MAG: hypothetical protein ABI624_22250 [Casimicrobiaceae bacterium]
MPRTRIWTRLFVAAGIIFPAAIAAMMLLRFVVPEIPQLPARAFEGLVAGCCATVVARPVIASRLAPEEGAAMRFWGRVPLLAMVIAMVLGVPIILVILVGGPRVGLSPGILDVAVRATVPLIVICSVAAVWSLRHQLQPAGSPSCATVNVASPNKAVQPTRACGPRG